MRVWKRSFAVVLSLILTTALYLTAQAETIGIDPYWANVTSLDVGLSFNNGKGSISGSVIGNDGTTKITANAVLECLNSNGTYTRVASWNNYISSTDYLFFDETFYVSRGYTYRLTITATVYINGVGETVSGSHSAYAD